MNIKDLKLALSVIGDLVDDTARVVVREPGRDGDPAELLDVVVTSLVDENGEIVLAVVPKYN